MYNLLLLLVKPSHLKNCNGALYLEHICVTLITRGNQSRGWKPILLVHFHESLHGT